MIPLFFWTKANFTSYQTTLMEWKRNGAAQLFEEILIKSVYLWRYENTRNGVAVGPLKGFRSRFIPTIWILWFWKQLKFQLCGDELPCGLCQEHTWMYRCNCAELFLLQPLTSRKRLRGVRGASPIPVKINTLYASFKNPSPHDFFLLKEDISQIWRHSHKDISQTEALSTPHGD